MGNLYKVEIKLLNMKKLAVKIVFYSLLVYMPLQANAWGLLGHRIVGQIAESYLTKKAKKEINKILGTESLAMASNWPDFIKSDSTKKYLDPWHYVNLSPGLSFDSVKHFLETATQDNIYNKINLLVAELYNKNLSLEQKQFNLKFLIHLIGDLHQPLHVGRLEDRGGNSVKVKWFGASSNLHRVWDEGLIEFQQLSYTEYARAINISSKEQRENLKTKTLAAWVFASYQVATGIYADITEPDQKLNYAYNYKYLAVLNNQLLEGGIHLANLLNEIFG